MLVRDRPDLHVFMLRRTRASRVRSGRHGVSRWCRRPFRRSREPSRSSGSTMSPRAVSSAWSPADSRGASPRCASASRRPGSCSPSGRRTAASAPTPALQAWRDALNAGHATLEQVLETEDLVVDVGALRVFSHWLTPRRCAAPLRHVVLRRPLARRSRRCARRRRARSRPSGCGRWTRSRRHARGDLELILPTMRCLEALARYPTVESLFAALDRVLRRRPSASARRRRRGRANAWRSRVTIRSGPDRGRFRSPTSTSVTRPGSRPRECRR